MTKPGSAVRSVKRMRFVSFVPPHCHAFAMHTHTHTHTIAELDSATHAVIVRRGSALRGLDFIIRFSAALPSQHTPTAHQCNTVHGSSALFCTQNVSKDRCGVYAIARTIGGPVGRRRKQEGDRFLRGGTFQRFLGGFFRYSFLLHFTLAGYLLGEAFHS